MASSDVCPTEDAVKLFLDYLVDPLLPAKSSVRDNPTLSQQDSVVKQVRIFSPPFSQSRINLCDLLGHWFELLCFSFFG